MLSNVWLYISFIITLLLISPIIFWNIHNNFITYTYHSNRVEIHSLTINTNSFLQAMFGQIFYYNPINVWLIIQSVFFLRKEKPFDFSIQRILLFTGLPIIIVVSIISLFDSVLPHWSGPGFVTLTFIGAAYLDKKIKEEQFYSPCYFKKQCCVNCSCYSCRAQHHIFLPGYYWQ